MTAEVAARAAPASEIYPLGPATAVPDPERIGLKAHALVRLARLGLPVPEGFVLGTALCEAYLRDPPGTAAALRPALEAALQELERASGLRFGDARRPLLVAVRSGAPVSMPGMMDTLLNIGLTQATLRGLVRRTGNPRLARDSYRRLVQSFAETIYGASPAPFEAALQATLAAQGLRHARELDFVGLSVLGERFATLFEEQTGERFPEDPRVQLESAIAAVFRSWRCERAAAYRRLHGLPEAPGTAVIVQRMVFGNAGGTSGSGVGFTRDPATGENHLYVDFLFNSQGEDVVAGRHQAADAERLARVLPEVWRQLGAARHALEREFGDAQEFEFTVQDGRLYLLQARSAKRTDWAALRIAVEQVREGLIEPAHALARLAPLRLEAIVRRRLSRGDLRPLARGVPASVGVASGPIALEPQTALRFARRGERPILICADLSTEDIEAIAACAGVVAQRGSRTAHAAVIARQLGVACLVGCEALERDPAKRCVRVGAERYNEGDAITVDANEGAVYGGALHVVEERPDDWLAEVARWRAAIPAACAPLSAAASIRP